MRHGRLGHAAAGVDQTGIVPDAGGADALAEIARTEEEHVDSGQRRDGVQLRQRLRILDLHHHESLLVRVLQVLEEVDVAIAAIGVAAVHRAAADRMEARHARDGSGIGQTHDVRHHDARGIQFERADVVAVAAP